MKKMKKKRIIKNVLCLILVVVALVGVSIFVNYYIDYLNFKTSEQKKSEKVVYVSKNDQLNYAGLYVATVKEDLDDFLQDKETNTLMYKIENESFYIQFSVVKDHEGNFSYNIDKIVDTDLNINARLNLVGVTSIEYRSSSRVDQSLIKVNTLYDKEFFAMTNGAYHLLGDDIQDVGFIDGHFYHMTYNSKYVALREVESCSKEVKKSIKSFNVNDFYYKYGRINFLTDYYQKLSSKTYTVGNLCADLDAAMNK